MCVLCFSPRSELGSLAVKDGKRAFWFVLVLSKQSSQMFCFGFVRNAFLGFFCRPPCEGPPVRRTAALARLRNASWRCVAVGCGVGADGFVPRGAYPFKAYVFVLLEFVCVCWRLSTTTFSCLTASTTTVTATDKTTVGDCMHSINDVRFFSIVAYQVAALVDGMGNGDVLLLENGTGTFAVAGHVCVPSARSDATAVARRCVWPRGLVCTCRERRLSLCQRPAHLSPSITRSALLCHRRPLLLLSACPPASSVSHTRHVTSRQFGSTRKRPRTTQSSPKRYCTGTAAANHDWFAKHIYVRRRMKQRPSPARFRTTRSGCC